MTAISLDTTMSIPDDVVFRELGGEAVILNLASGVYFGLDPVGTRMWSLFVASNPIGRVVDVLAAEYEVERAVLEQDVLELAAALLDKGLVQVAAVEGRA